MKLKSKQRFKLLALSLASAASLALVLACVQAGFWPMLDLVLEHDDRAQLNERDRNDLQQTFSHYEPKVKFNNQFFKDYYRANGPRSDANYSSQYLIEPTNNVIYCQPSRTSTGSLARTLTIVVNSRFDNFARRQRARTSWLNGPNLKRQLCSTTANIQRVEWAFALGRPEDRTEPATELVQEADSFGDLLMFDVHESYRNMTRKHLAIFQWLLAGVELRSRQRQQRSLDGQLLLKCDDDADLDLGQMISKYSLESHPSGERNLLMCARFQSHSPVLRKLNRQTTKWSLTRREWPYDTFPSYCSGLAYLASVELVEKLYLIAPLVDAAELQPPLWIDDVYVTGVLLAALEVGDLKLVKLNPFFCYTEAQRLHRESLGPAARCLAAEVAD